MLLRDDVFAAVRWELTTDRFLTEQDLWPFFTIRGTLQVWPRSLRVEAEQWRQAEKARGYS